MVKKIITVSRQFGSGGRSIAKLVAQKLGYGYYDKELIKKVAEQTNFDPAYVEEVGEYAPGKSLFSFSPAFAGSPHIMGGMSAYDYLWVIQRNVILELADKESCVIVGRCADFILKDREDCLNAFICAPMEYRAERIVRLYGESDKKPMDRLKDKDTRRSVSYKHFTGREWGDCLNYDITLNSAKIGIERCADIIAEMALYEDSEGESE